MNKNEIVAYVLPPRSRQTEIQTLATSMTTTEAIEAKIAQAKKDAEREGRKLARWEKAKYIIAVISVLSVIGCFSEIFGAGLPFVVWKISVASFGTSWLILAMSESFQATHRYNMNYCFSIIDELQPIAGTDACRVVLEYLEANAPGVANWRDIALAERGQLHNFDVSIMRALHVREEARLEEERAREARMRQAAADTISAATRQHLNEEACRKVHGLASLSTTSV